MSDTAPHSPPLPPGIEPQDDDEHINYGAVLKVAGVALTIFAVGIVYALWLLDHDTGSITQRELPPPTVLAGCKADPNRCAQVGIVEQRPIELEQRAIELKKASTRRLSSYGWIDQPTQLVHIPIEEAMKKVAEGERATEPLPVAPTPDTPGSGTP